MSRKSKKHSGEAGKASTATDAAGAIADDDTAAEDAAVSAEAARLTRRGFLVGGLSAVAGAYGLAWLAGSPWPGLPATKIVDGLTGPLRRIHEFNADVSGLVLGRDGLAPRFPAKLAGMPRSNGQYGLTGDAPDRASWRLTVEGLRDPAGALSRIRALAGDASATRDTDDPESLSLGFTVLEKLPQIDEVTEMKCIEGWSQIVRWTGPRLADLCALLGMEGKAMTRFVSLETADMGYYVGLDAKAALHPQTLLATGMDGKPLEADHGAPVRIATPIKYGIKSLKRLGILSFADTRPGDFWAERGYDWHSEH